MRTRLGVSRFPIGGPVTQITLTLVLTLVPSDWDWENKVFKISDWNFYGYRVIISHRDELSHVSNATFYVFLFEIFVHFPAGTQGKYSRGV